MHHSSDGVSSFSLKTAAYVMGRPAYAEEAIDFALDQLRLNPAMVVADIGAGTGLLTHDLRSRFREVFAIEPNEEMRRALGPSSRNGTAESTGLGDSSVDAVFAAQAFHWFNPSLARSEFQRVLRGSKPVALFWNKRLSPAGSGALELDRIMTSLRSQAPQVLEADETALSQFFGTPSLQKEEFPHSQCLEQDSLTALVLSRSYAPRPGDPRYEPLRKSLEKLFLDNAVGGEFIVPYSTQVYWGWL